jgi:hypothetical protein
VMSPPASPRYAAGRSSRSRTRTGSPRLGKAQACPSSA